MAGGALLQSAATTGNGNVVNCRGIAGRHRLTVIGAGTISAGDVTWEQNPVSESYAETWDPMAPPIAPVEDVVVSAEYVGVAHYVRARISNDVTGGGTVTVKMQSPTGDDVS